MSGGVTVDRPFTVSDHQAALELLRVWRSARAARLARYPTVWRLDQLLTTRLWQPECDAHVWEQQTDGVPHMVALALLWARQPDSMSMGLELVARPGQRARQYEDHALAWATRRAAQRGRELGQPITVGVSVYDDEPERAALLERHGFTRREGYNAYMARWLSDLPPAPPPLPDGYIIRQADEHDIEQYTALFDQIFSSMTLDHRRDLMRHPDYLHLVALTASGTIAAFCELSWSHAEWALGGPRYAWIDYLGTGEGRQRQGLGQALLSEAMRRARAAGAERVALITMGANTRARSVYQRMGFYFAERDTLYAHECAPM